MSGGPAPLVRVSTVEALERELKRRILEGELAPGMRLHEMEIASAYGVGRYTVRAAFQSLSRRGMVAYEPNRGVSVLEPTPEVVKDVYAFRAAIESEAARLIIERGASLDGVHDALERLQGLPDHVSMADFAEADLAVHEAGVVACGSSRMHAAFLDMADLAMMVMNAAFMHGHSRLDPTFVADAKNDHAQIVAALDSGKADHAVKVIRRHLYEMVPK